MRVVIDGLAIRGQNSLSIVSEQLLSGWQRISAADQLHLLVRSDQSISVPDDVIVHRVEFTRGELGSRLSAQSWELPRLCRSVRPDVLLGLLPTTALTPLPCRRVVIAWDFRDRHAAAIRPKDPDQTQGELCRRVPADGRRRVYLGADQAAMHWPFIRISRRCLSMSPTSGRIMSTRGRVHQRPTTPTPSLSAISPTRTSIWFSRRGPPCRDGAEGAPCHCGWSVSPLPTVRVSLRSVTELGLADVVTVSPWLSDAEYREQFAASSLVVFPSDFEGFGLPAVEAMRLGIPVVITPEPALLEVTDGHATVMEDVEPDSLARAVEKALQTPAHDLDAAQNDADRFTWANFASGVRGVLNEVVKA